MPRLLLLMTGAIIVAAGRGTRMGPGVDKLFLELSGLPVVAHTWRRFDSHSEIDRIFLVVRAGMEAAFEELAATLSLIKPFSLIQGGAERQDSVWNGISALATDVDLVAIQDGARPCTSADTISRCLAAARRSGAAVAAQRPTDTIKQGDALGFVTSHLDRSKLWTVQTPQCFQTAIIRKALSEVRKQGLTVTDDTAACESIGQPVELVECPDPNPKVTAPADLPLVNYWLRPAA
jgi:2-C-methyl-D-erythritol 4-phosphate cytidylyltransferase